ncbi:MAG: siphovirus Gp157 family protein [Phycisphaeraceae bacterium]
MSRTLYDITADMREIDHLLATLEGDISDPAIDEAITEWIEEMDSDLKGKVDGYAAYVTELLALAAARNDEAKRLKERAKVNENAAKRLKDRLLWALQERGIDKVETLRYTVSVSTAGGMQKLDVQVPAEELPPRFQKVTIDADNKAIREAIAAGEEVDGATLMERGTVLRIK